MSLMITFTDAACDYIKKKIAANKSIGFRLTVKKTGCSGFSYAPSMIDTINPHDQVIDANGFTVFVDPLWAHLFQGLKIDFVEEGITGLKQKRLVFINPNEASRCGCGESFHVDRE